MTATTPEAVSSTCLRYLVVHAACIIAVVGQAWLSPGRFKGAIERTRLQDEASDGTIAVALALVIALLAPVAVLVGVGEWAHRISDSRLGAWLTMATLVWGAVMLVRHGS